MTKLQQVEKKIREACPELMEMSFGCEVKHGAYTVKVLSAKAFGRTVNGKEKSTFASVIASDGERVVGFVLEDKETIIGHPIHLEHVLRAVGTGRRVRIDINIIDDCIGLYNGTAESKYNLTLPPSKQSPELINFIHEILCQKNN